MTQLEALIEALTIFKKYPDDWIWLSAEHDEIWFGPDDKLVSDEDKVRLEELGWHVDQEYGGFHKFV